MTFEGQYLTYLEFQTLGGSTIGEMPFNVLEYEARKKIDKRTQNRLINVDQIPTEVKMCMYKLINILNDCLIANSSSKSGITSEGIDGYSVSYLSASDVQKVVSDANDEIKKIISDYLIGVVVNNERLLYVGVR